MKVYKGSCHCGHVTFEVHKPNGLEFLIDCNCSVCTKKGLISTPVEDDELVILSGGDDLSLYQFGTMTAKYWFCPKCGVEPFHRSRSNPQRYTVNARCLDDFHDLLAEHGLDFVEARVHPLDLGTSEFQKRGNPYRTAEDRGVSYISPESPVNPDRR